MSARREKPALRGVTANRLRDGAVVYLGARDEWTTEFRALRTARDDAGAAALLATAQRAIAAAVVVGAYLIAVDETPKGLRPASLRERTRAEGPSQSVAETFALAYP
jgi:sulfite reductase (NADPH) hemoprotein beta-component